MFGMDPGPAVVPNQNQAGRYSTVDLDGYSVPLSVSDVATGRGLYRRLKRGSPEQAEQQKLLEQAYRGLRIMQELQIVPRQAGG